MYLVIRRYSNAPQLLDRLEASQADIEGLLRDVRGFVSYYLVRSGSGGASVTVCEDRAGAEESNLLAAEWITDNAAELPGNAPDVLEGETVIHVLAAQTPTA